MADADSLDLAYMAHVAEATRAPVSAIGVTEPAGLPCLVLVAVGPSTRRIMEMLRRTWPHLMDLGEAPTKDRD